MTFLEEKDLYVPVTTKGQKTRQKLLDAAEELFGTRGYFETSVTDITQFADVAQGTFYKYFPSKLDIFQELIRKLSHDFRKEIQTQVATATSAKEAQIIGLRTFFRWVRQHRNLYSVVQQAVLVDEALYRWYYERLAMGYVRGLQAAMEGGEFKKLDPETVAYSLMGIAQFIGMRWVYWEGEEVPDYVLKSVGELVFRGLAED